jgi:hypothetical protein
MIAGYLPQAATQGSGTFRTALMMIRACRDDDVDAYWILYEGVPQDRGPLLVKLLAMFAAVGRDDEWFPGQARADNRSRGQRRTARESL